MTINKRLTKVNYRAGNASRIKYIVIHYVGATGGALANCKYFENEYRGASAHYFVDHSGEIWQSVEDKNIAWHCGTSGAYKHKYCRNENSIGIEMCCRQGAGGWYFEDATVAATIELTKELMKKYKVPAENVIRHYDVTGKICPAPYVNNNTKHKWNDFKAALTAKEEVKLVAKLDNAPSGDWSKEAINWAVKEGILVGDSTGNYKLRENITVERMLVFLYRALNTL